ncbi:cupin [Virgibacillus doumboii]|uniref:cupin n=1 Tax=Virgibacillus doumboii TaxID=2697503 RepID=UPI0031B5D238
MGYVQLEEKGNIGYHQAVVPQLMVITAGEGFVRGNSVDFFPVETGDTVYWEKNEWHEAKTENGLTAIVIESNGLDPALVMAKEK